MGGAVWFRCAATGRSVGGQRPDPDPGAGGGDRGGSGSDNGRSLRCWVEVESEDQACSEVDRWRAPPRWPVPPQSRRGVCVGVGIGVRTGATIVAIGAMIAETGVSHPFQADQSTAIADRVASIAGTGRPSAG